VPAPAAVLADIDLAGVDLTANLGDSLPAPLWCSACRDEPLARLGRREADAV
jgi:hypothetical protein